MRNGEWGVGSGGDEGDEGDEERIFPMPHAQYPMPNAQCPMPHAQYPMLCFWTVKL
ncbi:histidine kinase [Nostoc sp.]